MGYYTIHLANIEIVRPAPVLRSVIEAAFTDLVERAGHRLNLVNVREAGDCDVSMQFIRNFPPLGGSFLGSMVLAEQSGAVLVGSVLEMRAIGEPTRRGAAPVGATRPIFVNGEPEFARCVGNIAVHELGHTIGGLPHLRNSNNYLYTGAYLRGDHPHDSWFNYDNLRAHWSGPRSFNIDQSGTLVAALRARDLRGVGMTR